MAKAKAFDRRRKSIKNIRKITRTMELISTAQFKRAMDRAISATAYTKRIAKLVGNLVRGGGELSHPLLSARPAIKHAILLVLTANRGMCGGDKGRGLGEGKGRPEKQQKGGSQAGFGGW